MTRSHRRLLLQIGLVLVALFGFFLGLDLLSLSFRLFGRDFAELLIARTANPFVGLIVGILATVLVQSSSASTSMTVGLVAAGALTVEGAIFIIMGANIGTSVTSSLVSLAHVTRRGEFERAFGGATLHDMFNWLSVAILFPFEVATGYLARVSVALASVLEDVGGFHLMDPVRMAVRPVATWIVQLTGDSGWVALIIAIALLFTALKGLVDLLKYLMSERAERLLHRTLFRSAPAAVLAGMGMTIMVQSSTITTSAIVPLVAAGVVTLERLFPFTIGANIGTTVTAMLAALSTGSSAAVTVAFAHLLFNLSGAVLVYLPPPMRRIPLSAARALGALTLRNRLTAVLYILVFFLLLPVFLLLLSGALLPERSDGERGSSRPFHQQAPVVLYWTSGEREAPHVL